MKTRTVILLAGAALGGLVLFLAWRFPEALAGRGEKIQLTRVLMIFALVAGAAAVHARRDLSGAVRHLAVWIAIGTVVFAGYAYRDLFSGFGQRMMGELLPHQAIQGADGSVTLRADATGHFVVEARVDGEAVRFLVDTGASDVVLSPADARRIGFDVAALAFTRRYRTANGIVEGAPVRLARVEIGPIRLTDVPASVNGAAMKRSLLGMSFLNRLSRYEVAGARMTLWP